VLAEALPDRIREEPEVGDLDAALELAREILANAPLTVRAVKQMVRIATDMGRTAALDAVREALV
jgi:enoyl-CoA hydratase/carnithine racemase